MLAYGNAFLDQNANGVYGEPSELGAVLAEQGATSTALAAAEGTPVDSDWVRLFFVDGPERSMGLPRAAWQELLDPSKAGRGGRWGRTEEWVEEGREQGIAQGRAEERALLCRLAERKFDAATARRLAAALEDVADAGRLAQVGDWIIECGTAADLLARVSDERLRGV